MSAKNHRLLLVEQSATMRYVIERHAQSMGYIVEACETYSEADECLQTQFQQFGAEFSGVLFGWPTTPQRDADSFAALLENTDYKDLPVVVMSSDLRAETRAWVAGRDNTTIIAWKEYQKLEFELQKLIDVIPQDTASALPTNLDNADVHLLVVDDSATIRYSLRDLFQMQGYQVTLASTQEEAIGLAEKQSFDIAVLDFYLAESTGDTLCRELIASDLTGEIICTVLTGTYSDHIIKRSLRAGAVECMFKNESSELLLSRIDALCRLVRQNRRTQSEQHLLEEVIESVAGAVLVISSDNRVVYVNDLALGELGLEQKSSLLGQPGNMFHEPSGQDQLSNQVHSASWKLPAQGRRSAISVDVDFQHALIEPSGFGLIRFAKRRVPIAGDDVQILQHKSDSVSLARSVIRLLSLRPQSEPFLKQMHEYLSNRPSIEEVRVSLLVIEVFTRDADGNLVSIESEDWLASLVAEALADIYKRENHFVVFTGNRFGFLLRYRVDSQAFALTRKIMQLCLELSQHSNKTAPADSKAEPASNASQIDPEIFCNASVLSLNKNSSQPMNVLMQHSFKGLDLVRKRSPNQALLLDLRRLLSAYPLADKSP